MALLKKNETLSVASPVQPSTILGPGSEFSGKLNFKGCVNIEGCFNGEISTDDVLIVGAAARVEANISAGAVVINGTFKGNISASQSVELKKPAKFYGSICAPSLIVERGVVYEGSCSMVDQLSDSITLQNPNLELLQSL